MIQWEYPPRCRDPHVLSARSHCEALLWNAPKDPRGKERVRLVTWTCDCGPAFFELCEAGGMRFIRRTQRVRGTLSIKETDRWPPGEADAMWTALLHGLVQ